jgi:biopolymer transport protein ExbD
MRINKRARSGGTLELNMTPMIDVVFLLMIYFMTTLNASSISKEPLILPLLKGTQEQTESGLTINISDTGEIYVVGQQVSLQELIPLVSAEIAKTNNDPTQANIVVRADRRSASRTMNQVVNTLERLQITRITIGVQDSD